MEYPSGAGVAMFSVSIKLLNVMEHKFATPAVFPRVFRNLMDICLNEYVQTNKTIHNIRHVKLYSYFQTVAVFQISNETLCLLPLSHRFA